MQAHVHAATSAAIHVLLTALSCRGGSTEPCKRVGAGAARKKAAKPLTSVSQRRDNLAVSPSANLIPLVLERARRGRAAPVRLSADDMRLFAVIAREKGIRSAAEVMGQPRSTVSRRLAELERVVGTRLVSRSTRQFALTELGETFLQKCIQLEELLHSTEDVTARAAREPTGTLSVAASPIIGEEFLPEVIDAYLTRFPRVRLRVDLSVDFVDLRRRDVDVAIRTGPLAETSDLFATRLGTSLKGVYASRGYLDRKGKPILPGDLERHDCIVVGGESRQSAWAFRERGAEAHVRVDGRLRVSSYRLARDAAAAGVGIARIPNVFARPFVDDGRLIPLLREHWQKNELYAVHMAGRPAPAKIRAFIELLRVAMKRHLAEA